MHFSSKKFGGFKKRYYLCARFNKQLIDIDMKLFEKDGVTYGVIDEFNIRRLLAQYQNGNYMVYLFDDGTKVRETEGDDFIPAFSENTDVCLTKKCCNLGPDGIINNCKFCYEGCTPNGKHGRIDYHFLDTLHAGTEVALNGNDMDHPQLDELLHKLKEKGVFANITVSKNQFLRNYEKIIDYQKKELLYGIGISANSFDDEFIKMLEGVKNSVVHTIAGICTFEEYKKLFGHLVKVLVLGYKNRGRGVEYLKKNNSDIYDNIQELNDNLQEVAKNVLVLSFDNLAIEQLQNIHAVVGEDWDTFYMGDDGNYTFYIDLVAGTFAKNSCIDERFPIGDKSMDDMFNFIRDKYGVKKVA